LLCAWIAALLFAPEAALAADLSSRPPADALYSPVPAAEWSGLYSGAFAGATVGSFSTREISSGSATAPGFTTGALAGYAWRYDRLVYGVEADIASNALRGKISGGPGLVANEIDSVFSGHARARIGYDIGPFEPFAAAGLAYDRLNQYRQEPLDFNGAASDRLGWTVGAGVDAKVELPILGASVLRAEYLYDNLPEGGFDLNGPTLRTGAGIHTVRLALIARVGESGAPAPSVEPTDWSGAYVGVIGGGARQRVSTSGLGASTNFDASGAFAGVYSGRNWMFDRTMLGIEGSSAFAAVRGKGAQPGAASSDYNDYFETDLRARAGYAWGRFLPFVAAGLAFGESEQSEPNTGDARYAVPAFSGTLGAGVDIMASDRIVIRAEYLYARTLQSSATHLASDACCDQSRQSEGFRLGLGYFLR
jgi:outer membrane immunogenic protein